MYLPGYRVEARLAATATTLLYRGHSPAGEAVLIEVPRQPTGELRQLARYQRAYELAGELPPGVTPERLVVVRTDAGVAMVWRDPPAVPLRQQVPAGGLPLDALLAVSIAVARNVLALHAEGIVHLALCPDTLLLDATAERSRLVTLEFAFRPEQAGALDAVDRERSAALAFAAPEACSELAIAPDFPSDLYSLGAIFHFLAVGSPPFAEADPAALVHAHATRVAASLTEQRADLPRPYAELVARLLNKQPDDRYLSATGLLHDLEECRRRFQRTGAIRAFALGQRDVAMHCRLPDQLFGREREVERVLAALTGSPATQRVAVLVSGPSGIGKTALVQHLRYSLREHGIRLWAGKFDQFRQHQPFLAFLEATRGMLRQALSGREAEVQRLKERLAAALGPHGRLLTDAIPELAGLLGPQPELDEASPNESSRRFNGVVVRFLRVFADEVERLVLFLDDLQWADPASLELIGTLVEAPDLENLVLMLGFRSDELWSEHPVRRRLEAVRAQVAHCERIELGPLPEAAVRALLARTLSRDGDDVAELARHVHHVARGNPFFVREYLQAMQERGLITLDAAAGCWRLDLARLGEALVPESVTRFLVERIDGLSAPTVDLLETASCIGSTFTLRTLAQVHLLSQGEAASRLEPAVAASILVPHGGDHQVFQALGQLKVPEAELAGLESARYRFRHDQVRLAVHDRLDERLRASRHLNVVRLLLQALSPEERKGRVVELFSHVIDGASLVEAPAERLRYARIGLQAGRAVYQAQAFATARRYFRVALELLPDEDWCEHHGLVLGLNKGLAECALALGEARQCEALAQHMLAQTLDPVDRAWVQGLRLQYLAAERRFEEASDVLVEAAGSLGVRLARRPHRGHVLMATVRALLDQWNTPPSRYASLPPAEDRKIIEAVRLLANSASTAYFSNPNMLPLIGILCTRLSLVHGLNKSSAYGFAVWGLVLCGVLGWIERGSAFGELSLAVGRRYPGPEQARAAFVVRTFILHWTRPYGEVAAQLLEGWEWCRKAGDEETAVYSGGAAVYTWMAEGASLDFPARHPQVIDYLRDANQPHTQHSFLAWAQLMALLQRKSLPEELSGPWFDFAARMQEFEREDNRVQRVMSLLPAAILDVLAGRHERAERRFRRIAAQEEGLVGQSLLVTLVFFRSLNTYRLAPGAEARRAWRDLPRQRRRLRRWARHAPDNLAHRVALLEAEALIAAGRHAEAVLTLHHAASLAGPALPFFQALALQRLAEVLRLTGNLSEVAHLGQRVVALYARWGSPSLAHQAARALDLAEEAPLADAASPLTDGGNLDLQGLMGAVGAISSEIDQDALLERLMTTLLRAGNADRGLLVLLDEAGTRTVEVEAVGGEGIRRLATPLADFEPVAGPVVELTLRGGEPVAVNQARSDALVADNAHVARAGVESLLGVPISIAGRVAGAIYLENHAAAGAFPPGRVAMIRALGTQTGIALENARLYRRVQEALVHQTHLAKANHRFVPQQVLASLGYESITEVELDHAAERQMTVLFADLRAFTRLSEEIGPGGTIRVINRYLAHVQPGITANGGFIGSYLGDGVLALFPDSADAALHGAIAMARGLASYNDRRGELPELQFGIGVQSGQVILGTIGDPVQMQCGVLGDAVNTASRLESLTKHYGADLLVGEGTVATLRQRERVSLRCLGRVALRGRREAVTLYECLDVYPDARRATLLAGREEFEAVTALFQEGASSAASQRLAAYLASYPDDVVARRLQADHAGVLLPPQAPS
ncbi:AAA family ATPase [Halomonas sp. NO4]|uniref:AAA family ATPase n=1 Tax=Halomonas sp. NO4 TaxID=2484813 RepID=UPI0013CFC5D0|nr:AAA family ATPase [Halomonas sp. NO4]